MAKVSGRPASVTVAGANISNDVTSLTLSTPYGSQETTGLDKSAMERIVLLADVQGTLEGVFNTQASMSHATLKTPGSKTFVITIASSAATATFTAITTDYQISLGADGSATWSVPFSLSNGTALAWT